MPPLNNKHKGNFPCEAGESESSTYLFLKRYQERATATPHGEFFSLIIWPFDNS